MTMVCFCLTDFQLFYYEVGVINYKGVLIVACVYRGFFMSARVLLNLLNDLRKRDKMRGLPIILNLFRNDMFCFCWV